MGDGKKFGSKILGWEKIGSGILDKHPGSATLKTGTRFVHGIGNPRH
jgi:hypothetical protein